MQHLLGVNFMVIIGLAVLGAMALSAFWYSPRIFGNAWVKLTGCGSGSDCKGAGAMMLYTAFAYTAIALTLFVILCWAEAVTAKEGVIVGLWVGLGLSAMNLLIPAMWEGRAIKLFLITAGITVANTVFMAAIMSHLMGKFYL